MNLAPQVLFVDSSLAKPSEKRSPGTMKTRRWFSHATVLQTESVTTRAAEVYRRLTDDFPLALKRDDETPNDAAIKATMTNVEWLVADVISEADITFVDRLLNSVQTQTFLLFYPERSLDSARIIDLMKRATVSQVDVATLCRLTGKSDVEIAMRHLVDQGVRGLLVTSPVHGLRGFWQGEWMLAPMFDCAGKRDTLNESIIAGAFLAAIQRGEPVDFATAYASAAACYQATGGTLRNWGDLLLVMQTTHKRSAHWPKPFASRSRQLATAASLAIAASILFLLLFLRGLKA